MITSIQNNQVKAWKKLHQRKYRKESSSFLVEGYHLVEEAFHSDWKIQTLLIREDTVIPGWANHLPMEILSTNVFKEIAETKTPQGIAAIVHMRKDAMRLSGAMLLTDGIQNPGNLGTMIRTADALGFSQILLGKGTVDLFNEKVIRASQGSIFHLPIREADLQQAIVELKQHSVTILASTLDSAVSLEDASFTPHTALIVGNEGDGVTPALMKLVDEKVKIPITGKAESLNVAVAAGIMMYVMREGN